MYKTATVALGGNYDHSKELVIEALELLKKLSKIEFKQSSLYQTAAISPIAQSDFINAACSFKTDLSPHDLFHEMEKIEKSLGKVPKPKDFPRPIDLDLLFYEGVFSDRPELTIPHPLWQERLFVLEPLSEITDCVIDPRTNTPIFLSQLIKKQSAQEVKKLQTT